MSVCARLLELMLKDRISIQMRKRNRGFKRVCYLAIILAQIELHLQSEYIRLNSNCCKHTNAPILSLPGNEFVV